MDYFALDRPRVYMPLSRAAVAEAFPDSDPRLEGPWHPHVVMDARPTKGARDFVLVHAEGLADAREAARKRHAPLVDEEISALSQEDLKERCDEEIERAREAEEQPHYRSPREYRNYLLQLAEIMDRAVQLEVLRVNAVRVAVMAHDLAGNWLCYASSWGEERPAWPRLDEPGAFEARLAIISKLAAEDVERLALAATKQSEVSEDESKKSEPAPS